MHSTNGYQQGAFIAWKHVQWGSVLGSKISTTFISGLEVCIKSLLMTCACYKDKKKVVNNSEGRANVVCEHDCLGSQEDLKKVAESTVAVLNAKVWV